MGRVLELFANSIKNNPQLSDFDWFWDSYPKRKAKLDAMKAWQQTRNARPPIEELIAALDKQASSDDWYRDGGAYIPYPATWLRRGQWADE